ncbi:hypothetical protein [Myxosarcina sp. GI1]|nr:hypothetical protein [Myxosarcina sp. GI1]
MNQTKAFDLRNRSDWDLFVNLFSGFAGVGIGVVIGSLLGWI